jgi:3-oxoacyl-[acyl-carrier-protein] synthase III
MLRLQANRRIIEATTEHMKLPPDRVMVTIQKFGNTTAATIALLLDPAITFRPDRNTPRSDIRRDR